MKLKLSLGCRENGRNGSGFLVLLRELKVYLGISSLRNGFSSSIGQGIVLESADLEDC